MRKENSLLGDRNLPERENVSARIDSADESRGYRVSKPEEGTSLVRRWLRLKAEHTLGNCEEAARSHERCVLRVVLDGQLHEGIDQPPAVVERRREREAEEPHDVVLAPRPGRKWSSFL